MFKSTKKTPTFQVSANIAPRITITREAISKMQIYVDQVNDEVGWLGTAHMTEHESAREIVIDDVFLMAQEVHGTTTEITPDGLSDFAERILSLPNGMDLWNNMRVWGHSHVNMGTSPSGQDDKQMREFADIGHPWFVRLIANKKGDIRVDFYEYATGVTMLNLNWEAEEVRDAESDALEATLNELYAQIAQVEKELADKRNAYVKALEPSVKEEIKLYVKKKTYARYTTPPVGKYKTTSHQQTSHTWDPMWDDDGSLGGGALNDPYMSDYSFGRHDFPIYLNEDVFPSQLATVKADLHEFFTDQDCIEMSRVRTRGELKDFIAESGFASTFTESEAESMWKLAQKHYSKYQGA